MRRWIVGFLIGIARTIGWLVWPLLALWIICHYVQFSIKCPSPREPSGYLFIGASNGTIGVLSIDRWRIGLDAWFELTLHRAEGELQRWLPSRRREDLSWTWEIAHREARDYRAFHQMMGDRAPVQLCIAPILLLVAGVAAFSLFLPRRVYSPPPNSRSRLRYIAWGLIAAGLLLALAPAIELGRVALGGTSTAGIQVSGEMNEHPLVFALDGYCWSYSYDAPSLVANRNRIQFLRSRDDTKVLELQACMIENAAPVQTTLQSLSQLTPYVEFVPSLFLRVPHYIPAVLAALLAWWSFRLVRRRSQSGHCRKCSYNLTGNASGICPECGTPIRHRGPRRDPLLIRKRVTDLAARSRELVWPTVATAAVLLLALDVTLLGVYAMQRVTTAEPLATAATTLRAWCFWGVVWLSVIAATIAMLYRRIEPPGNARSRLVVAANLVLIIFLTWPLALPQPPEKRHDGLRDSMQIAEL